MRSLRPRRPSPAMIVALLALVVAMSGTGYAAVKLARNSVQSKHIKAGAVTSSDIKNRTIRGRDIARGVLREGPTGPRGAAGTAGERGATGERGPQGPADGPAGGDLTGSYPAPQIAAGAVGVAETGARPAVRVQQQDTPVDAQEIPNSTATTFTNVVFQVEAHDTDGMFDPAEPDRITIRTAGIYSITSAVRWDHNATGTRAVGIVPNTSNLAFLAADTRPAATTNNHPTRQNVSTVARLTPGTVIVLKASQDSGTALEIDNAGSPQVHLSATWLAP